MRLLSPIEEAYLNGTKDFTKAQQRYIRYRLKKKLRLLDESRDAAAAGLLRLGERGSSLVRIPPPPPPQTKELMREKKNKKEEWAGSDSNQRSPPCQGGILTRLDHRPDIQ
jgi:hypothetical protein